MAYGLHMSRLGASEECYIAHNVHLCPDLAKKPNANLVLNHRLVWVVCLVASPVVGLLSEARGHPPGVDIARHVPVKRLKTALKQN